MTRKQHLVTELTSAMRENLDLSRLIGIWHSEGMASAELWMAYCHRGGADAFRILSDISSAQRVSRKLEIAVQVSADMIRRSTASGRDALASQICR